MKPLDSTDDYIGGKTPVTKVVGRRNPSLARNNVGKEEPVKKNLVPLLGIAFVVAIIATGIFYGLFVGRLRSASVTPGMNLVVAGRTLEKGTVVEATDLKLVTWSAPDLPKGAITEIKQAAGMTLVETMHEGEAVLTGRLASKNSAGGAGVPSGMRAVSIHVTDSSGVVTMLHSGQKVDVQVVGNKGSSEMLRTILQNVEVLSTSTPEAGKPVVNLLARPPEADALGLADSTARIRLVLRNPLDDESGPRPPVGLPALMTQTPAPPQRRLAPVTGSVTGVVPPAASQAKTASLALRTKP